MFVPELTFQLPISFEDQSSDFLRLFEGLDRFYGDQLVLDIGAFKGYMLWAFKIGCELDNIESFDMHTELID